MRILNIHRRTISRPRENLAQLLETLATKDDKWWPWEQWPAMRFKKGKTPGAVGGHGPVRYSIERIEPGQSIEFKFLQPAGFNGVHRFELLELENENTEIIHTIEMNVSGTGVLTWIFAIRWLHDALLEDCLDKIENQFSEKKTTTPWNVWVRILRSVLKPR